MTTRIDAHHHVWDLGIRHHDWLDPDKMAPVRRTFTLDDLAGPAAAAGVSRTVLVQVLSDPAETAEFLELAAGSELVAGVVGWIDLTAPDAADVLAAMPGGLVAVRHGVQSEPDPGWLTRPDVRRGLAAVAAAGLSYDLLTLPHQLPAAIDTAAALPELTFVLDHLSKPPIAAGELEPWRGRIRRLAALPNVYCKLSGMVTEADWASWQVADLRPYAEIVLEAFGPERVMFGSDWPVCLLAASYERVAGAADELCAGLSESERADVFAGTARRAYRLPG
ncbi:amidohydrolase family protein [Nonomuraea sp. K274]|uniref:Amidohydrolase family protein n=1 Tax=Nonomuraea cypriaca TaxID=1187855 RepID=A0A931A8A8_9ACTN|nr:amidohydrolase family protein [Nonomuraea cypriaca]MBF8184652.1 amidohydrolase family protein [Nonomuraea cypriaca]